MIKRILLFISFSPLILMMGCSSAPYHRAEAAFSQITQDQGSFEIQHVPLLEQDPNQCGAASLATLLKFEGEDIQQQALYEELYVPNKQGSYQSELIALARQYDLLPYARNSSMFELLTEIHQNKPTLVLLNMALKRLPTWHYAVVTGYDNDDNSIILHSGRREKVQMGLKRFERAWRLADHWAMSLHNINHMPTYADPDIIQRALANFELLGKKDLALTGYKNVLKIWPNQHQSLVGIGNILFEKKDYPAAIDSYHRALELSDNKIIILHNLSLAYQHNQQLEQAYNTVLNAIQLNKEMGETRLKERLLQLKAKLENKISSQNS